MPKHHRNIEILAEHVKQFPKISSARIGAMISFKTNRIIAGNSEKSHPFQIRFANHEERIYPHAETNVIQNASQLFSYNEPDWGKHSTLYIVRLAYDDSTRKNLHYAMSKPCDGCMRCIATFGIRSVYYTVENGWEYLKIS